VVTAILLQKETGGNLVEVLDRTTAVIRERLRIQGEIRIHTAQGRLTGWILSLLPVVMFFLLSLANRGYTRVLIEDPTGRKLIYTGAGSDRARRTDHPQDCERQDMNGMNPAIRVVSLDGDRVLRRGGGTGRAADALVRTRAKRLMEVTRAPLSSSIARGRGPPRSPATGLLLGLVRFIRTRLGFAQDEKLRQKLLAAGLRDSSAVDTYFGIRCSVRSPRLLPALSFAATPSSGSSC
jgi:hypothetical protein